ncbi:MAG: DUF3187 family protein, partial [Bdellovibrionales bacterium]|nr:DUF3187 family protein [Bdellovibrionales bacterium]
YGMNENLELEIQVPFVWRGGGVLDSTIDGWHQTFGFPRGGRERLPEDEFQYTVETDSDEVYSTTDSGWGLGNMEVGAKFLLDAGDHSSPAVSLVTTLSLPTANDGYGHEAVDYQVGLLASKRWQPFTAYGGVGYTVLGSPNSGPLRFKRHNLSAFAFGEIECGETISFLVGALAYSDLLDNAPTFPAYSVYLDTGFVVDLYQNLTLALMLRENPAPRKGTTDVTFFSSIEAAF